jgi:hypothetical protein
MCCLSVCYLSEQSNSKKAGRLLASRPSTGVFTVDETVRGAGVGYENRVASRRRIKRDMFAIKTKSIEK